MEYLIGIVLIAVLGCAATVYFFYWLPAKAGHPKVGRGLAALVAGFFVVAAAGLVFEDELFSKSDARKLLREQGVLLQDDFTIQANHSSSAPGGDYYHSFTLHISAADSKRVAASIRQAPGFERDGEPLPDSYKYGPGRYDGPPLVRSYATAAYLNRELFQPHGVPFAPTYRVIAVSKTSNELIFTDFNK
ncbi:hypothetical protein LGH70_08020 [Hymenobacter sp. BT635]|uniref:Uncharacterized protein n=1 Tax=Hymenobacter nitidus TaxID=2880929 RepID=A0ABS8ADN5_9BACT|nr:hypothetical protein [Hymenobacter nitidus]MCB2377524.1 hypothetical protein [Hymenobacter nitidus]